MKKSKLFLAVVFSFFTFSFFSSSGCWTGSCDDEPLCPYCDASGCYDEQCMPAYCTSDNDCWANEYCNYDYNQCFPTDVSCWYDWECPDNMICDESSGYCVNPNPTTVCHNDWDCPESSYCDEFSGKCVNTAQCTTSADCEDGFYCDSRHVCSPRPSGECINDSECGLGAYCNDGTCNNSTLCQTNTDCTDPSAPVCDDRGVCIPEQQDPPVSCVDNSGCPDGKVCVNAVCEDETPRDPSWNCMYNEHCGENGVCVDGQCFAACLDDNDCGTGQHCAANGYCEDNTDAGTECVANSDCADANDVCINGICHDSCVEDSDCSNAKDHCVNEVCVPNDAARPQCYTNGDCNGGEECFEGICRVPCQDNDDCVACPGNPICATGGYCMENNDINPECQTNSDCSDSKICVDAMCVDNF